MSLIRDILKFKNQIISGTKNYEIVHLKSVSSSKSLSSRMSCREPRGQYSVIIKEKPGGKRQTDLVTLTHQNQNQS